MLIFPEGADFKGKALSSLFKAVEFDLNDVAWVGRKIMANGKFSVYILFSWKIERKLKQTLL